ncbi:MAG: biotin/lipoyl-containing protein [Pseudomonadota bacterium]
MKLSNEDVLDMLQILDKTSYQELHVQTDHFKLSLRRGEHGWTQAAQLLSKPNLVPAADGSSGREAPAAAKGDTQQREMKDGLIAVRAPLPGTFYHSPKPGSPPFIEIGSLVEKNSVIGIIETMKLMNSVYAGVAGKIVEISTGDAQIADENAVLVFIAPEKA